MLEELREDRDQVADIQAGLQRDRENNGSAEHAEELAERERN